MLFLHFVYRLVWGIPALALIIGVGIYISRKTGFVQFRLFPAAMSTFGKMLTRKDAENRGSFRALCTALGATVGTGNIVGVAGAICMGGPGAIFWMWICGLLGMATKFAEVTLAQRYRIQSEGGTLGGPMYMICYGMGQKWRPLAVSYCVFGMLASFGVGNMAQVNAVLSGIHGVALQRGTTLSFRHDMALGLILMVLTGAVLLGGAKRIGGAAQLLIPSVSCLYILLCLGVLCFRFHRIPMAFACIFRGAFSPEAVTGGVLGSVLCALRIGCARGVFTNEAGMGTASMAHACADPAHPVEQGLMGIVEVFLDTIVLCTMTALVILVSGVEIPYGMDQGGMLTVLAFSCVYGSAASLMLSVAMGCFAFATILGWGLYGMCCARFLFGRQVQIPFALLQTAAVLLGAAVDTESVWLVSELFNGLMAIPNLIVLAALTSELARLTNEYEYKIGSFAAKGGNYADFHQCKPL